MGSLKRNLVRATLLATLVGCGRADVSTPRPPTFIVAGVILSVDNRTGRDKDMFLGKGTREHPLGRVRARSARSFSVPSGMGDSTSELRLEAREGRTASVWSDAFRLAPGGQVVWVLGANEDRLLVRR